jgi:hypothetical protein
MVMREGRRSAGLSTMFRARTCGQGPCRGRHRHSRRRGGLVVRLHDGSFRSEMAGAREARARALLLGVPSVGGGACAAGRRRSVPGPWSACNEGPCSAWRSCSCGWIGGRRFRWFSSLLLSQPTRRLRFHIGVDPTGDLPFDPAGDPASDPAAGPPAVVARVLPCLAGNGHLVERGGEEARCASWPRSRRC